MAETKSQQTEKVETNPYHPWAARFWQGMLFSAWVKLAASNGLRIHPFRWGLATTTTLTSIFNSTARPVQELIYGRRLRNTKIKEAPIFIIGHWRSGTTLLHELLVLDPRHTFPTTYECFAPNHFLITAWLMTRLKFLLPSQRPMDNMTTGWERPQEDEFALCNMGIPSPYLTMAFPNNPPQYTNYLDMEGVPVEEQTRWKEALLWFLQRVTYRSNKRIVLKSPPHTSRIKLLLELFPDARFVHIVRDPYAIFPSTMKLWKTLYKFQGFQLPRHAGLDEYVFSCFERMYTRFEAERQLIPPSRFFEVRYEDLVQNTVGQVRALYDHLGLGEFENLLPRLEAYLAGVQDYKTNKHQLDPALRAEIDRRWGPLMRKYGYCQETSPAPHPAWPVQQGRS